MKQRITVENWRIDSREAPLPSGYGGGDSIGGADGPVSDVDGYSIGGALGSKVKFVARTGIVPTMIGQLDSISLFIAPLVSNLTSSEEK